MTERELEYAINMFSTKLLKATVNAGDLDEDQAAVLVAEIALRENTTVAEILKGWES